MSNKIQILLLGPAGEYAQASISCTLSHIFTVGFLGGTVLEALFKHPKASQFDITTFARAATAEKVQAAGIKALSGSLTDLENAVANAAVVFNFVSSTSCLVSTVINLCLLPLGYGGRLVVR